MKKGTKKKIKSNIIIIILAFIIALALFYFSENWDFFSASIISLQDAETMKKNNRDIWYKNQSDMLDVFVSDELKDINNLTISIIYDPDNTLIDVSQILPQWSLYSEILTDLPWNLVLKFSNFSGWFDYQNSLFELPFSASSDVYNALISQATIVWLDWNTQPLSIWLLNENNTQSHGF